MSCNPRKTPKAASDTSTAGAPKTRMTMYWTAWSKTSPVAPMTRTVQGMRRRPRPMSKNPHNTPSSRASVLMAAAMVGSSRPSRRATSVCEPTPRKLNTQKMPERRVVPTPRAASGEEPRRAIKAVSTNPVTGSATRENRTGIDRVSNVLWGALVNGWSTDVSGLDSKRSVLSSPKK